MYTLNVIKAIKKMSVKKIQDFIFENVYNRIGFSWENSYYSIKRLKRKKNIVSRKQVNRKNT